MKLNTAPEKSPSTFCFFPGLFVSGKENDDPGSSGGDLSFSIGLVF